MKIEIHGCLDIESMTQTRIFLVKAIPSQRMTANDAYEKKSPRNKNYLFKTVNEFPFLKEGGYCIRSTFRSFANFSSMALDDDLSWAHKLNDIRHFTTIDFTFT